MANIFGTFGSDDDLQTSALDDVYGLAGNDILMTVYDPSASERGGLLIGGTGNDTYRIGERSFGWILETGNDNGDRLEFPVPFFPNPRDQLTIFIEYDNRHLLISGGPRDSSADQDTLVLIADWRTPGVIEQFQDSTDTVYDFEVFQQLVPLSPFFSRATGDDLDLTSVLEPTLVASRLVDSFPTLYLRNGVTGENVAWFVETDTVLQGIPLEIPVMPPEWLMEATGDLNGDGKDDLIWWNRNTGETAVWFMNGADILSAANIAAPDLNSGWRIGGSGDLNGDHQDDLIWHNEQTGEAVVWYMNGAVYAGGASIATLGLEWSLETVADLNGDNRDELIWRNYADGRNVAWEMDGGTITSGADIGSPLADTNWEIRGAADFNYDGTEDLLWQHRSSSEMIVWNIQGTNVIGSSSLPALPNRNWEVTI